MKNNIILSAIVGAGLVAAALLPANAQEDVLPEVEQPKNSQDAWDERYWDITIKEGDTNNNTTRTEIVPGVVKEYEFTPLYITPATDSQNGTTYWPPKVADYRNLGIYNQTKGFDWQPDPTGLTVYEPNGEVFPCEQTNFNTLTLVWRTNCEIRITAENPTRNGQYVNIISVEELSSDSVDFNGVNWQFSYTWNITRKGVDPQFKATGIDFGDVPQYTYKRDVATIENTGDDAVTFRDVKIVNAEGVEVPEFAITGGTCNNAGILPDQKCQVQVQYYPVDAGPSAAYIKTATNGDPLSIPLTGNSTTSGPEPEEEVPAPEKPTVPDSGGGDADKGQEVTQKKNGTYVVKTEKKKIKVKWKAPDTTQPVLKYEIRKKFKKKSWGKWKDVDPEPNKKGWIKTSVKAKKDGKYKLQVVAVTPLDEQSDKATVTLKKKK